MRREFRILKKREFENLFVAGIKIRGTSFTLYYLKNNLHMKVGICLEKKIGNSVKRNLIKRQVRSMFDSIILNKLSYDLIVLVKHPYKDNDYLDNKRELLTLIEKIKEVV